MRVGPGRRDRVRSDLWRPQLAELATWAVHTFPGWDWEGAEHHHGAFHDVLVLSGEAALRVLLGEGARSRAARELTALHGVTATVAATVAAAVATGGLRVAVPRALSPVAEVGGRTGYVVSAVPGTALAPDRPWAQVRDGLAELLSGLAASVPGEPLPPVRAWCGGERFPAVVEQHLAPLLDAHATAARRAVAALLDLPAPRRPGLVHGDFGAHNVLWDDGAPAALIDWDHACRGDVALDVAPLVGAHGAEAVSSLVDDEVLTRAMVHRATLPLQVAAAAHLAGRAALRDHALASFRRRCEERTLHDPGGATPGARRPRRA